MCYYFPLQSFQDPLKKHAKPFHTDVWFFSFQLQPPAIPCLLQPTWCSHSHPTLWIITPSSSKLDSQTSIWAFHAGSVHTEHIFYGTRGIWVRDSKRPRSMRSQQPESFHCAVWFQLFWPAQVGSSHTVLSAEMYQHFLETHLQWWIVPLLVPTVVASDFWPFRGACFTFRRTGKSELQSVTAYAAGKRNIVT